MSERFDFMDDYSLKRGDTARFPFIFNEVGDDGIEIPMDLSGKRFDMHVKMRNSQSQPPLAMFSTEDGTISLSSNVITIPSASNLPVGYDEATYWAQDSQVLYCWDPSASDWAAKGTYPAPPNNYVEINISHTVSRGLPARQLYYDLQEIDGQQVSTYIDGIFEVIEETTDRGPL